MARFTVQPLKHSDPAGEVLQQARQQHNFSLNQVARKLNIPLKYIEALESGDWEVLPAGDYGRYFLRQYAIFLGLDAEQLLAQYPGPNRLKVVQPPVRSVVNTAQTVHPLRRWLLLLVALVVLAYLIVAARTIFLPPKLQIISPVANGIASVSLLAVSGITMPGTEVTINNEPVAVTESGEFLVTVSLRPGFNTLTIKARKGFSREITVERIISYTPPLESDAEQDLEL